MKEGSPRHLFRREAGEVFVPHFPAAGKVLRLTATPLEAVLRQQKARHKSVRLPPLRGTVLIPSKGLFAWAYESFLFCRPGRCPACFRDQRFQIGFR